MGQGNLTKLQHKTSEHKKKLFYCGGAQTLKLPREVVSILRHIQNLSGHSPRQPAVDVPA